MLKMKPSTEEKMQAHIVTPLVHSLALSTLLTGDIKVYLKLENVQPAGSFKIRGIGRLAKKMKEDGCKCIITASGGNAGLAVSQVSKMIDIPCTIFVPETAPAVTVKKMKALGAQVKIIGENYSITEQHALEEAAKPGNGFVHPYNNPEVWAGHSTIIHEIKSQLPQKPGALIVSVGGGGLLLGVLEGLQNVGWQDVPIIAMETLGAHCFNLAVQANALVVLEKITSIANCLGASCVPQYLMDVLPNFNIISEVVSDQLVVESCIRFSDDERILVEPSCGASLAAVYGNVLERLKRDGKLPSVLAGPVVVIVCGGTGVTLKMLHDWAETFNVKFP